MTNRGVSLFTVRALLIGCMLFAALAVFSQAAPVPGWLAPWRSVVSSNDFLTGGTPLNGAVTVSSAPPSGLRSGADDTGYLARARRTNPLFGLGDFVPIFPMSEYRHGAGVVVARGPVPMDNQQPLSPPRDSVSYLYIVGGMDQGVASGTIERAEIDAEGGIYPGLVSQAGLLMTPRYGAAAATRGNFIYVIGGYDGNDLPVTTLERFEIDGLGDLGEPELQAAPGWGGDVSAVIVNGYLYVIGGNESKRGPVEAVLPWIKRARIDPRGDLGLFEEITTSSSATLYMPVGVAGGRAIVVAGWESNQPVYSIYYIGGNIGDSTNGASRNVYRLKVASDNSIADGWVEVPHGQGFVELVDPRELFAAVVTNGYLYVIGGETTTQGLTTYYSFVERAAVDARGVIGQFVRLDGSQPTYINEYNRASDISGAVLNNHVLIPGGRDAWGISLNQIFDLRLDQGGDSLLADPVPDTAVFSLVRDLGHDTVFHSLAFDVGPDKASAAGIRLRFRSAIEAGSWGAWTPYFNIAALPSEYASTSQIAGEVRLLLDLSYAPGSRSCLDAALVPNPTNLNGPVIARYMEYEVMIPEGSPLQKLHRLTLGPRPMGHFALPGGYDPTRSTGPHPPSCAPGHAIADMGVTNGWVRFTGVGFNHLDYALDSTSLRFVSPGTQIPITVLAVEVRDQGRTLDVKVDIGVGQGGPFSYDLVYDPVVGDPVTLLSPAIKVHSAPKLEDSRHVPGLDVKLGNASGRENVVEAPSAQKAREKVTAALFGEMFRTGRVDDTKPLAVEDPNGPAAWPSNPYAPAGSQVSTLRYKVVDVTPASPPFKPIKLWDATDPTVWREVARGEFVNPTSFKLDLEVPHKTKSGPHDLEITVQNPQMGRTVTVTQTVYVVPAFDVTSFKNTLDPSADTNPDARNRYDWTDSYDPAVADLGDGVAGTPPLTIGVTGLGFQSDTGSPLIAGVAPVSPQYAPRPGLASVADPFQLTFPAEVFTNTIPRLHQFKIDWAYVLGVSDPYLAGTQIPPTWGAPAAIARTWTPDPASWLGLYVVPPRVKIQSIFGTHNTNDPIIVLQSDPTMTVNGAGFATHGPSAGGFASTLHEMRLISMVNSPDEDVFPMQNGVHMVSDCQARFTMNVTESQRPGQMYTLEIETSLPDLESRPGSRVRHPYSISQGASMVTVLPLPVCEAATPTCFRSNQGTRLNGVVVTGRNFDIGTTVDLGPGVTIENLDVCHDNPARGCVAQDKLTFDVVVSPLAAPGARLLQLDNGAASGVSARAACASPAYDFWIVPVPTLSNVHPSALQQPPMAVGVKTVLIDIYGTNIVPGAKITQVTLAGGAATTDVLVKANSENVVDSGHLTAELIVKRTALEGTYKLRVSEPSGPTCGTASMTADATFEVTAFRELSLTAVTSQTSQCQGRSGTLAVTGANFKDPSGGVLIDSVSLGPNVTIDSMVVTSLTALTIDYSIGDSASLGKRPLILTPVTQGATPATWPDALNVTSSPSIVSASPAAISDGTSRQVTISGRNFYENGVTLTITPATGITVSSVIVDSTGQISATVTAAPGAGPEPRSITVMNGDGGQCNVATLMASFRVIPEVSLTGVANTTTQCQGRSGVLTVTGTNFEDPSGASLVGSASLGPNVSIDSLVVDSATQMTIGYSISDGAPLGKRGLTVSSNVQGAAPASWADALTITSSPSIVSVSPRSILSGSGRQFTITGRNFYENGADVRVSPSTGVTVSAVSVANTGQILATIDVAGTVPPGSLTLVVTNADGGSCAVATLNGAIQIVDPPHVTSWKFSKSSLKILGMNFHPSMQAYVGGTATPWSRIEVRKNSIVTLTHLKKAFKEAFPEGVEVQVKLVNPDDGGESIVTVVRGS